MKIHLSHNELVALVQKEIKSMGLQGEPRVEFNARRGGEIDVTVDLQPMVEPANAPDTFIAR